MIFKITARADDDIIGVYIHGAREFGARQAEKYHAGLLEAFQRLAANPYIARDRQELRRPVRLYFYEAHVVVYQIMDDHILIVRVLHGRQDWESHL